MRVLPLLLATFLVALVSSCTGSILAFAAEAVDGRAAQYSFDVQFVTMMILAIGSFFILLAALLVIMVPVTILLDRLGIPPAVRDLLLVAGGTGFAALAVPTFIPLFASDLTIGVIYGLVTSLFWVLAVRWFGGKKAAMPAEVSA